MLFIIGSTEANRLLWSSKRNRRVVKKMLFT